MKHPPSVRNVPFVHDCATLFCVQNSDVIVISLVEAVAYAICSPYIKNIANVHCPKQCAW